MGLGGPNWGLGGLIWGQSGLIWGQSGLTVMDKSCFTSLLVILLTNL